MRTLVCWKLFRILRIEHTIFVYPHVRLAPLVQYVKVGIVGGSDQVKICEQLGSNGESTSLLPAMLSMVAITLFYKMLWRANGNLLVCCVAIVRPGLDGIYKCLSSPSARI